VTSGVPQGSHLGPVLFLVFVNSIETILRGAKLLLFADDAEFLQMDLKGLETWCTENKMDVNASKCKVISFGKSRTKILYSYKINDTMLERVSFIRDLGVIDEGKITRPNCFIGYIF
jgi:ribonuclease P/MRP protein subunit RPP40